MSSEFEVLYRPSVPPESEAARWRGFEPGVTLLPKGTTYSSNGRELTCDIVFERDVEVPMSDGTILYADVFRPADSGPVPAILAWSPYGKQGGFFHLDLFPNRVGVPEEATSGLEKFEGPDPAFWCEHGYAVVNVDARGTFASQGDIQFFSPQERRDGHDTIEWIAAQDWCADAVTMSGNSWLGAAQWAIAGTRPPHLAAIAPWEGFTDPYRDICMWGGIPDEVNPDSLIAFGRNRTEDIGAMMKAHPTIDEYWRSKVADVEAIDVPAYVVASWTNPFHVRGTLDAFTRLDQSRSWLRVHNRHEWVDLYQYEDDLLRFFDHFVKGVDNGWTDTPRVRLSILDPGGTDIVDRPENEYPLARAVPKAYYLDAGSATMSDTTPSTTTSTSYDAADGTTEFRYTFTEETELTGPLKLRIHVETTQGDDCDLYVYIRKLDTNGQLRLTEFVPQAEMVGNKGQLRASHRALDPAASTPLVPVPAHSREQRLAPGEIVPLEIPIRPLGMLWHAGEQLQVLLSARNLQPAEAHIAGNLPDIPFSTGEPSDPAVKAIRVHTGGRYDSHLLVSHVP
ncbi:CocE/NonD family hydrolase [Streptomyces sp. NPDC047081]|uniref:CocE/NonD family hydrolase n=1 Tax=Streptomyces sp. NPDC047081 TaxID=3154706 RepID=UPI0033FADBE6